MILQIIYIILALLAIGILIFIHELGHFWVGRKVGMRVKKFSIGFGPAIKKWRKNDVDWQLCWLPFGGFVQFAGMENEEGQEPHEIKDGFFGKSPKDRIKVAFAGPFVNLVFAFLLFCLIWTFGGRNKSFTEYTKHIGWVDPKSQLYANDVNPGDEILKYGGKNFTGFQDLLYFSAMNGDTQTIEGYKINYYTNARKAYEYTLPTYENPLYESLKTIGVLSMAQYLIYNAQPNISVPMAENSPLKGSGLEFGDRIIWVDGELIFSQPQLSNILNSSTAFLTVKRGENIFQTKVPRIKLEEMIVSRYDFSELDDWRHEAGLEGKSPDLYFIPYNCNGRCIVEKPYGLVDEKASRLMQEGKSRAMYAEALMENDQIIAVDGQRVQSSSAMLSLLQKRKALIVVQKNGEKKSEVLWKNADEYFSKFPIADLEKIIASIGTENMITSSNQVALLKPIEPVAYEQLSFPGTKKDLQTVREEITSRIKDPAQQKAALDQIEQQYQKLSLGILLQDQKVRYNPNPFTTFYKSFTEIWRTLFSFVSGYLHPKFLLGPVGIVQSIQRTWGIGWKEAFFWIGVISLNLGILNLLPIPVFDGGHILFSCIEWITKKPIKPKTLDRLILPFVLLLIAGMIFMTYHDLSRIIRGLWG